MQTWRQRRVPRPPSAPGAGLGRHERRGRCAPAVGSDDDGERSREPGAGHAPRYRAWTASAGALASVLDAPGYGPAVGPSRPARGLAGRPRGAGRGAPVCPRHHAGVDGLCRRGRAGPALRHAGGALCDDLGARLGGCSPPCAPRWVERAVPLWGTPAEGQASENPVHHTLLSHSAAGLATPGGAPGASRSGAAAARVTAEPRAALGATRGSTRFPAPSHACGRRMAAAVAPHTGAASGVLAPTPPPTQRPGTGSKAYAGHGTRYGTSYRGVLHLSMRNRYGVRRARRQGEDEARA